MIERSVDSTRSLVLRVSVFCLALLLLSSASACSSKAETTDVYFRKKDGTTTPVISSEVARTGGQIQLGLMYRKEMAASQGMLFVFGSDKPRSFWMKNTYLELDMIFVNSEMQVVSITRRAVPLSETPRKSEAPATYVLEVLGGSAHAWGLEKGDTMVLPESFQ